MIERTYGAEYKCRLCGAVYTEQETSNKMIVYDALHDMVQGESCRCCFGLTTKKHSIHHCEDGSIGLSDFQGWKLYDGEVM